MWQTLRVSDSTGHKSDASNQSNEPNTSESLEPFESRGGGAWPGYPACVWGLIFAAISFYWGSGGPLGLIGRSD